MTTKELKKQALKEYNWYISNIKSDPVKANTYAATIYEHALECGWLTEKQHDKLILELPFLTFQKGVKTWH